MSCQMTFSLFKWCNYCRCSCLKPNTLTQHTRLVALSRETTGSSTLSVLPYAPSLFEPLSFPHSSLSFLHQIFFLDISVSLNRASFPCFFILPSPVLFFLSFVLLRVSAVLSKTEHLLDGSSPHPSCLSAQPVAARRRTLVVVVALHVD